MLAAAINVHVVFQAKPGLGLPNMSQEYFSLNVADHRGIPLLDQADPITQDHDH